MMRFVVTGCARSGTSYVAKLLTETGIPCGHELVYGPGSVKPWPDSRPGESSWLAAPHLHRLDRETVVLHQVRHPLAVVRSHLLFHFFTGHAAEGLRDYVEYVGRWTPEVLEPTDELGRTLRFWERWNLLVEA